LWGSLLAFTPICIWAGAPLLNVMIPWNPTLFLPSLLIFPLSIGFAILRYRLWEIDVIVNRTLVYGALTISLVLIYWVAVVALEQVFRRFTGSSSPLSIVLSTLVIAGSFNPLRRSIQTTVDRRFYRQKYDAIRTLAAFGANLRDEVDLDRLIESLEAVIRETVHPAKVLAWTRDARSFVLHQGLQDKYADPGLDVHIPLGDPLVETLQKASTILDLDRIALSSDNAHQLQSLGLELILPLTSQKKLIGWLGLGPRLGGHDYSTDDRSLLANLSAQAGPAVRVAQLVKMRQEDALKQERLEHEMRVARQIQYALLPNHLPDLQGWKVASYYQPARAVGGDFYDFLFLEDGRIAVFIGDVTDKGVPAALVMATTRSLLRAAALQVIDPGRVLEEVNELLLPDIPSGMFVTCLFGLLDPSTGHVRFANAGHNLPVLRRDRRAVEIRATGMPLGLMPDMKYEEKAFEILPGECILLYSDGLVEAHNPEREMFGFGRMRDMAASEWDDASSIIQCLLTTLKNFTGDDWEQEDDVTLVALKRNCMEE
jgi:serine phosphatase RsbU (regulator of sigma subunit)